MYVELSQLPTLHAKYYWAAVVTVPKTQNTGAGRDFRDN